MNGASTPAAIRSRNQTAILVSVGTILQTPPDDSLHWSDGYPRSGYAGTGRYGEQQASL